MTPSVPTPSIRDATEADALALQRIYNHEVREGTATFDVETRSLEEQARWLVDRSVGHVAERHGRRNHPPPGAEHDARASSRNGRALRAEWPTTTARLKYRPMQDDASRGLGHTVWGLGDFLSSIESTAHTRRRGMAAERRGTSKSRRALGRL